MEVEMMMNNNGGPILTWKLYNNPQYSTSFSPPSSPPPQHQNSDLNLSLATVLLIPIAPAEELDPVMKQVKELKAELEMEKRIRRKAELAARSLAKELAEEKGARAAAEALCEKLAEQVAKDKEEIGRLQRQVEQEQRMLRTAEVLRKDRVQMKFDDARLLLEDKIREISSESKSKDQDEEEEREQDITADSANKPIVTTPPVLIDRNNLSSSSGSSTAGCSRQRKELKKIEVENPHIKRGIKGFVEFPRILRIRSNYSGSGGGAGREVKNNQLQGNNLVECQKAQLRILLKQRSPAQLGLVGASAAENLVM